MNLKTKRRDLEIVRPKIMLSSATQLSDPEKVVPLPQGNFDKCCDVNKNQKSK